MVTFVCPMCDAKLDNSHKYKEHVRGISHGKGQAATPAQCPVGKDAHFGTMKQAQQMTKALEQPQLPPSRLSEIVDTLRGMKPPPAIVEPSYEPPTPDEIAKMSSDDLIKVFNELKEKLLQPGKRVVTGEPDSEVYFRYDEQVNPIEKIYVGSGKTEVEYESGGRKKYSRKGDHDSVTKKANRESTAEVDNKPLTYVKLLGDLCEQTARTFENALYWSLHPSRLSNDKRSPPQYLGRIKDKKSGDWRDATHAEVRGLVCSLFVEKLTQLGLSLAPAATIEEEAGSDEKEEEPARKVIKRAEETPMKQGSQKKLDTAKTPATKTSSSPPVTTTKKVVAAAKAISKAGISNASSQTAVSLRAIKRECVEKPPATKAPATLPTTMTKKKVAAKKAISKTGNPNASSATAVSQRAIKRECVEKPPATKAPATLPTTMTKKKVAAKKAISKTGNPNASSATAVSQRAIKRECIEERGKSIGPSSVQAVGKSSRQEVPTKRKQVISKVSQRATVQSGASHKTTGATTEIRPIKSSKRTAQVGDAPPKKVTKYSSTLPSTSTKKKGEKRG